MEADAKIGRGYAWYVLGLLTLVYVCHIISRFSTSVVVEPIKAEFHVSDSAMGLLGGMVLSLAYAVVAIPMGWLVDSTNRRKLLAFFLTIWSVFTLLGGLATSFAAILLTRAGVGAAEASSAPTCLSLIADVFPAHKRATAISIFYTSTYMGTALVFLIGGSLAEAYGWRSVLIIAGVPGLVLALVVLLTLRDTRRGQSDEDIAVAEAGEKPGFLAIAKHLSASRVLRHATIALTIGSLAVGALNVWLASFLIRNHGLDVAQAGIVVALGLGCAQAIGALICGPVADRLSRRHRDYVGFVPAVTLTLALPVGIAMIFVPSTTMAVALAIGIGVILGGWVGPGYSLALGSAPASMRGSAIAYVNMVVNVLGVGLGPLLTGVLSDAFGGSDSLRYALACVLSLNLWAALHFFLATGYLQHRREARRAGAAG